MRSSSGYIFVLIWVQSQVAQAYTTFEPECTTPKEAVSFVSSPPTRGTLDILWSSLFTIFACTWTILHLNIPKQRDTQDPGRLGDLKWGVKAIWGKAKWMLMAIMAPEYLLYNAAGRLSYAWEWHLKLKVWADADDIPWTLAHTTFASMSGFVVRGGSSRVGKEPPVPGIPATPINLQVNDPTPVSAADNEWYFLDPDMILRLRSERHIILPFISKSEIDDHSKGDLFTKGIAASQIIWTIASTITRAIRGLAISQLEISVIAFSLCALLIYICYWSSPKDVSVPITFLHWEGPIPPTITRVITEAIERRNSGLTNESLKVENGQTPFSNDFEYSSTTFKSTLPLILVFGALLFGAPHLLAWNSTFPTPVERIIWRVASLNCSSLGLVLYLTDELFNSLRTHISRSRRKRLETTLNFVQLAVVACYVLARLFLIVETFRTILFLPPSAYIATWTSSVPMFG
ncbi:hypothetical protein V495_03590 [Pseudogymnoascus sp. VKM F-4514 (FW-929)]|nr:hypothetical protein V495_03590 [Pseudogymnoascus sp. VKM F-4514 (FW-929)]KFY61719.1 hypothetical protein V497_02750 [Pseudogymnoascus sp. VKM F-4516 (FW-969)]